MNGMLLQLVASGAALSLMGGAVTVHYVHVREVSSAYEGGSTPEGMELASYETNEELVPVSTAGAASPVLERRVTEKEVTLELLEGLVERMEVLSKENNKLWQEHSALTEQLAEANLDLSRMKFRLDTHSESFRPLRVTDDSNLRPLKSAHPVLPPKDWKGTPPADSGWRTRGH